MTDQQSYPYDDGDVTVLGPEIFASQNGDVISWKGENYTRQQFTTLEVVGGEQTPEAIHELAAAVRDLTSAIRQNGSAMADEQTACVHPEGYEGECPCPPSCGCCRVEAAVRTTPDNTATSSDAADNAAADNGPTVADCAKDDRRWPLQKAGE